MIHVGHVRSESQSVQYVPFDIWTSFTAYKIKVHNLKYGTSVRENLYCNTIDKLESTQPFDWLESNVSRATFGS